MPYSMLFQYLHQPIPFSWWKILSYNQSHKSLLFLLFRYLTNNIITIINSSRMLSSSNSFLTAFSKVVSINYPFSRWTALYFLYLCRLHSYQTLIPKMKTIMSVSWLLELNLLKSSSSCIKDSCKARTFKMNCFVDEANSIVLILCGNLGWYNKQKWLST